MKSGKDKPSVLVHQHIFGNAGEFVDQYLHAAFAAGWGQIDQKFPDAKYLTSSDVLSVIGDRHPLRACSTMHSLSIGQDCRLSCFALVADPIVRAKQVFLRVSGDSSQPNHELARDRGFKGYIEWALEGGYGGVVIRNYQTLHLSKIHDRAKDIVQAEAGHQELEEALEHLSKLDFVGVVDRPVCSVSALQQAVGNSFPELKMDSFLRYFASQSRPFILDQRATIKSELGEELFERLIDANCLDKQLHDFALMTVSTSICESSVADKECNCLSELDIVSQEHLPPLFFLHIPKTAGTAFSLHLKNKYHHHEICPAGYWPELLEIPKYAREKYRLIAGHFSDLGRVFLSGSGGQCVTVLRNPIERVLSLVFYQKHLANSEPQNFANIAVSEMALSARSKYNYDVESILNSGDFRVLQSISNYQTRVLSGSQIEPAYVLRREHLELAKRNLLRYKFVGLTEFMQESLDMLSFFMGWAPIDDLIINETPHTHDRKNVPQRIVDKIRELNGLDIQLYEFARELFYKQRALFPFQCSMLRGNCDQSRLVSSHKALSDYYEFYYEKYGPVRQKSFISKLNFGLVGGSWWEWEERGGCRWTGPGQDSYLDLPIIKFRSLSISFHLSGYATDAILASAVISADGERLDTEVVTGFSGGIYLRAVAMISSLNPKLPFLRVGIHLVATMSAKDINPAARNNRRLGLAVHSLEVKPLEDKGLV